MKNKLLFVAIALLTVRWTISAFGLMGEHMAGFPVGQPPQWPAGMADLLNCPNRVYGYFFNFGDTFFFAGEAQDFNDFIERYAKLEGISHKLTLHPGQGTTGLFGAGPIRYDWQITMSFYLQEGEQRGDAGVSMWLGGQVALEKVKVPANVVIGGGGDSEEVAKFLAAHEAKRGGTQKTTGASAAGKTESDNARLFKSKRLLFAKVALTEDGSKVLSMVLDESGGTRTGYDLLYADVNFNGRFDESERLAATATKRHGSWLASSSFAPIRLDVPYNKKGQGIANRCQVCLGYRQYPRHGVAEEISIVGRFRLRQEKAEWEFAFSGGTKPSKSLEKTSVWRAQDKPELDVFARPDGYRKGNLGIGLTLSVGENKLECLKNGEPVKAHVEIKKPDGEEVHEGEATLDRFTFG